MNDSEASESIVALFADQADEEGMAYMREHVAQMSAEELVEESREACMVLEGLAVMAEALGWVSFTVLSDARSRAQEVLEVAEALSSRA